MIRSQQQQQSGPRVSSRGGERSREDCHSHAEDDDDDDAYYYHSESSRCGPPQQQQQHLRQQQEHYSSRDHHPRNRNHDEESEREANHSHRHRRQAQHQQSASVVPPTTTTTTTTTSGRVWEHPASRSREHPPRSSSFSSHNRGKEELDGTVSCTRSGNWVRNHGSSPHPTRHPYKRPLILDASPRWKQQQHGNTAPFVALAPPVPLLQLPNNNNNNQSEQSLARTNNSNHHHHPNHFYYSHPPRSNSRPILFSPLSPETPPHFPPHYSHGDMPSQQPQRNHHQSNNNNNNSYYDEDDDDTPAASRSHAESSLGNPHHSTTTHNNNKSNASRSVGNTTPKNTAAATATLLARHAVLAGFLQRSQPRHQHPSGSLAATTTTTTIITMPQRFFVLQPATHLYEFASPHDTAPTRCWDLEGSRIVAATIDGEPRIQDTGDNNKKRSGAIEQKSFKEQDEEDEDDDDDGSLINPLPKTSTAHHGITIVWDNKKANVDCNDDDECDDGSGNRKNSNNTIPTNELHLQARSALEANLWCQALEQERLSHARDMWKVEQARALEWQTRAQELERIVLGVEADRDCAVAESKQAQKDMHSLDEAIRRLVGHITSSSSSSSSNSSAATLANIDQDDDTTKPAGSASCTTTTATIISEAKQFPKSASHSKDSSELQVEGVGSETCSTAVNTDEESEHDNETLILGDDDPKSDPRVNVDPLHVHGAHIDPQNEGDVVGAPFRGELCSIDVRQVPGVHFSALYNAVDQLRENWRLACVEATEAVEDVTTAHSKLSSMEHRLAHAESHLCQIWEENCALRKSLKQKKREKRVLVREIKTARAATAIESQTTVDKLSNFTDEFLEASDEEKLIRELEDHVMSSIRLHEAFLSANGESTQDKPLSTEKRKKEGLVHDPPHLTNALDDEDSDADIEINSVSVDSSDKRSTSLKHEPTIHPNVPLFEEVPIASLLDEIDDESDDSVTESPSMKNAAQDYSISNKLDATLDERPNPLLYLHDRNDADDTSEDGYNPAPPLCATSSQSESSSRSSKVTHEATSTLSCPLADVVAAKPPKEPATIGNSDDWHVYHLTFYSRKIGIQFQKVPPPPAKVKGLLTEAMTDELAAGSRISGTGSGNTAAELRRISAIATHATKSSSGQALKTTTESVCELAIPVDAVLVCGFHGFDDSGSNVRPKLGARLVAFDGVSVEVGKWTFDAVRKAIQARGRPLTLSFRNDFLTTEQRRILTKAVQDVDAVTVLPSQRHAERGMNEPKASVSTSSTTSAPGVSSSGIVSTPPMRRDTDDDNLSQSGAESDHVFSFPQSFSGARSIASASTHLNRSLGGGDSRSVASSSVGGGYHHNTFRSFSEACSSSVLSAVAPLVSNLLLNMSLRKSSSSSTTGSREPFTPEYLRRAPESVEGTPQHQDFQSELL